MFEKMFGKKNKESPRLHYLLTDRQQNESVIESLAKLNKVLALEIKQLKKDKKILQAALENHGEEAAKGA